MEVKYGNGMEINLTRNTNGDFSTLFKYVFRDESKFKQVFKYIYIYIYIYIY